jgi:hypothetical protein
VSGLHAVRVAAAIRRELGADVEMVHGRYGEFKVIVDDATVVDGGSLAFLGVMPSLRQSIQAVQEALGEPPETSDAPTAAA